MSQNFTQYLLDFYGSGVNAIYPYGFTREYKNWGAEYFYLFRNDRWYVRSRGGRWKLLKRVLRELNKPKAEQA
jgi:hypothetical protein